MTSPLKFCIYIFLMAVLIFPAGAADVSRGGGSGSGGLPNNPYIDSIKNAMKSLSVIPCSAGYILCYDNENIYGDSRSYASMKVSPLYISDTSLKVDYSGSGTRYYMYRGLTSWSQVSCSSSGCDGQLLSASSGSIILDNAPSTTQQGVIFVAWDYNSYNGYWSWSWSGAGFLGTQNFNLKQFSPPTPAPTPVPTPAPTPIPTPTPSPTPTPAPKPVQPVIISPDLAKSFLSSIFTWLNSLAGL